MKFRKLILASVLALCAGAGFVFAKASSKQMLRTHAMTSVTGDPDLDVGINVKASDKAGATWDIGEFYLNGYDSSVNFTQGDYIAFRIDATHGGSYMDVYCNINGEFGAKIAASCPDVKYVTPDYQVAGAVEVRDFHPAIHTDGQNGWICLPKAQMTDNNYGASGTPDWTKAIWAVQFQFYGTTNDVINFDLGDMVMADIVDGRMVIRNYIFKWTGRSGDTANGSVNFDLLKVTRNNENLIPGVNFTRAIQGVDTCDDAACLAAYTANEDAYDALNPANLAYLEEAIIGDYADGDTSHAGGKYTGYKAAAKWDAICAAAGVTPSQQIAITDNKKSWMIIVIVSAVSVVSLGGLFFVLRRRRLAK